MIRRWFTLFVTLLLGATFLTACTSPAERDSSEQPRVLTQEESERLATSRWRNVDAGTRTFTTTLTAEGQTLDVTGLINFTTHTGTAAMGVDGASDAQLVAWDVTLVRVHPAVEGIDPTVGEAPPVDSDQWQSRPLDAAATAVDALLLVLLSLGSDQPENPLLLRQSATKWLASDTVNGIAVDVFGITPDEASSTSSPPQPSTGTETLRIWADNTGVMHRAEILVGAQWIVVDFGAPE